ncbi:hypothetical protein [Eubacterium sp. CAG:161]|uniref:hypothetical protein n=1 Tax=Eubacterium sp. CAG:161 TaxID=1262881 RepID=UPI0003395CAB|nr:hypothetical protein [Eubacterium sp. CAG:161]CCY69970.1 unknown [Eubacterium sp. CAG:161]
MREVYTSPEVELVEFDTKDVITTSWFCCALDVGCTHGQRIKTVIINFQDGYFMV